MTARDLPELIAQWREPENPPLNQDQLRQAIRNGARMDCADELEAALAGAGAVAWMPTPCSDMLRLHLGDLQGDALQNARAGYELAMRLATTHPAPVAVGVDEAMVLRAIQGWDDYRNDPKDGFTYRGQFRAALTAALEAKPHA